jgi:hypothetical protein
MTFPGFMKFSVSTKFAMITGIPKMNKSQCVRTPQRLKVCLFFTALLPAVLSAQEVSKLEAAQYKARFVSVEPDVKLEVLDWGGTGRPLVFLAGLGLDAHEFETFVPKFSASYHVCDYPPGLWGIKRSHPRQGKLLCRSFRK